MKTIEKKINKQIIKTVTVTTSGGHTSLIENPALEIINQKLSPKKINRKVLETYGEKTIVTEVINTIGLYSMDLENFLTYAKEVKING